MTTHAAMNQDKQPQAATHTIGGIDLNLNDVPKGFYYCFNDGCPRAAECLRHIIGQLLPPDQTEGLSVFPQSYQAHDTCRHYRSAEPVRLAWGISGMFANVYERDAYRLRLRLHGYFGSKSTYHRYERGRYKLTPKMQQEVLSLFAELGYDTTNLRFNHYEEGLDLTFSRAQDLIAEQENHASSTRTTKKASARKAKSPTL